MPRTLEQILRDFIGSQTLNLLHLQAEVERLRALEEFHKQEAAAAKTQGKVPPEGTDHATPPTFGPIVK